MFVAMIAVDFQYINCPSKKIIKKLNLCMTVIYIELKYYQTVILSVILYRFGYFLDF